MQKVCKRSSKELVKNVCKNSKELGKNICKEVAVNQKGGMQKSSKGLRKKVGTISSRNQAKIYVKKHEKMLQGTMAASVLESIKNYSRSMQEWLQEIW